MHARMAYHSGQNLKRTSLRAFFSTISLSAGEPVVDMLLIRSLSYAMVGVQFESRYSRGRLSIDCGGSCQELGRNWKLKMGIW
jgi:hypothetical protein